MRSVISRGRSIVRGSPIVVSVALVAGIVVGATGGTFVLGVANTASSQTGLTATTAGNGLLVQNSGTGNGGVFISNAATGIAGVTRNESRFALAGTNDGDAFSPAGGAVSASGKLNHGVNASTQNVNADAVRGVNAGTTGVGGFANGVYGETRLAGGNGIFGYANTEAGNSWGAWGLTDSATGVGVVGDNSAGGLAGLFFGDVEVLGEIFVEGCTGCATASTLAVADGALAPGTAVTIAGVTTDAAGEPKLVVRAAGPADAAIGIASHRVAVEALKRGGARVVHGADGAADGETVLVVTGGLLAYDAPAAVEGAAVGTGLATQGAGVLGAAPANTASIARVAGRLPDGRTVLFVTP